MRPVCGLFLPNKGWGGRGGKAARFSGGCSGGRKLKLRAQAVDQDPEALRLRGGRFSSVG